MIPKITDPLGKHWTQPDPSNFTFISNAEPTVGMSVDDFCKLREYSRSYPTGVYEGKMWKAEYFQQILRPWPIRLIPRWRYGFQRKWYLRWYENSGKHCVVKQRRIVFGEEYEEI